MPETSRRAAQIAAETFDRPPDQRSAFLEDACGGNPSLRAEVESLLAADAEAGSFLGRPAVRAERTPNHDPLVGTTVDGFTILRRIAVGGMGAVYEAEQANPHRRVALKLVRPGAATPNALKRFEHEAHVLARLQHPGIAQIFDAGSFDAGQGTQPFFAMELIDGQPLTRYADSRKLHTRQRLELFADICDAVHYAHLKGVIHRDIKPGNVLVDAEGHPKVLDFGVARVTDADVQTTTLHTQAGELLGTLPYMSPEQVLGDAGAIDVRSDVYGLGVMLYELLSGKLPHDLKDKPVAEAARIIREDDVTPLSSVNRIFRGDLDTIVAKALDRDPDRRYSSAAELAADARRYLNDEPIAARPASTWYQVRKFARRNREVVSSLAMIFLVLVAGIIATGLALARARANEAEAIKEAAKSEQIAAFTNEILAAVDPRTAKGMDTRLLELILDNASQRIEIQLREQPEVEATIRNTIGMTYMAVADYESAREHLVAALDTRRLHLGDDHPDTLESIGNMCALLQLQGKLPEAEPYCREALEGRRRILGDDHPDTFASVSLMGRLQSRMGNLTEAEQSFREALEGYRRLLGDDHPRTLDHVYAIGGVLYKMGQLVMGSGAQLAAERLAAAEGYLREALEARRRVLGDDHLDTLMSSSDLGLVLMYMGRPADAEPYTRAAMEGSRRILGDEHPHTLTMVNNMGWLLKARGEYAGAEQYFREVLEIRTRVLGDDHPRTLASLDAIGWLLRDQGLLAEAEPYLRKSLDGRRRILGGDHPDTLATLDVMGWLLSDMGKLEESDRLYNELLARYRRTLDHKDTRLASALVWVALGMIDREQFDAAERLLRECLDIRRDAIPEGHWLIYNTMSILGESLAGQGTFDEAEALHLEAWSGLESHPQAPEPRVRQAVQRIVDAYAAWGKPEQAAKWQAVLAARVSAARD